MLEKALAALYKILNWVVRIQIKSSRVLDFSNVKRKKDEKTFISCFLTKNLKFTKENQGHNWLAKKTKIGEFMEITLFLSDTCRLGDVNMEKARKINE